MTKKDFASAVKEKSGIDIKLKDTEAVIDAVMAVIADEVAAGNAVTLNTIGSIKPVDKPAKECRNPRTGEKFMTQPSKNVKFSIAKALKDRINS